MTTLIANVSCSSYNLVETLSTLRFANRAKSIQNRVIKNEERSVEEIKSLWKRAEQELRAQKELVKKLLSDQQNGKIDASRIAHVTTKSRREDDREQKVKELMEALTSTRKELEQKDLEVEELSQILKGREMDIAAAKSKVEKQIQRLEDDHAEALREQHQAAEILQMQFDALGEVTEKLRYENEELKRAYETKEELTQCDPEAVGITTGDDALAAKSHLQVGSEEGHQLRTGEVRTLDASAQHQEVSQGACTLDASGQHQELSEGGAVSLELRIKIRTLESDLLNRCQKVVELEMSLDRERDYISRLEEELKSSDGEPFSAMALGALQSETTVLSLTVPLYLGTDTLAVILAVLSRQNSLLQQRLESLGQHHRRLLRNFAIEQTYSQGAKRSLDLKRRRIGQLDAQLRKLHAARSRDKEKYNTERQDDRQRYKQALLTMQREIEYHKVGPTVLNIFPRFPQPR